MSMETPARDQAIETAPNSNPPTDTNSSWYKDLPQEYRDRPSITRHENLESLIKQYEGYASSFGVPAEQLIRLPKERTSEAMGEVYARLGRPDTPDAYKLDGINITHESDKVFVEGFRGIAHQSGLNQGQVENIVQYLGSALEQTDAALAKAEAERIEANKAALKSAWGEKAQIYETAIPDMIIKMANKAGLKGDDVIKDLHAEGFSNSVPLMKLLAVMSDMVAEPNGLAGAGRSRGHSLTVEQAQSAKAELFMNTEKMRAYHDGNHPQHKFIMDELQKLNVIIANGA